MAFNEKEKEIINWGLQNGKSKDEVKQAITNYRLGIVPSKPVAQPEQKSGVVSDIISGVKGNISEASNSLTASAQGKMNPFVAGANIAKNTTEAVLQPINQTVGKAVSAVTSPLINWLGDKIGDVKAVQDLTKVVDKHPQIASFLGDIFQTGMNTVALTTLDTAGQKIKPAVTSAVEKGTSLASDLTKTTGEIVSSKLENASPSIMNRVARLKPTDATKFKSLSGKTIGDYLVDTKNFGTPDQIIANEATKFSTSIADVDSALAGLKGAYKNGGVSDMLAGLEERAKLTSSESVKSPYLDRVLELKKINKKSGLSMSDINEVKRLYEKNVKLGYNKTLNPDKVELATNIDNSVREWQVKQAEKLGFTNIAELNKQTQLSKFIINKLGDQLIGKSGLNAVNLTDWIVLAGGDPTSVGALLTKKFFSSKAVQSKISDILSKNKPKMEQIKPILK
jgi:hypothetical protein